MIQVHSKLGQEMRTDFERLVSWYGRKGLIPDYIHRRQHLQFLSGQRCDVNRNQYYEQFSGGGKRVWQSSALGSPTTILDTDLTLAGDDIEPSEVPLEDVEMRNDEDEEPLEAEVPRARKSPKNRTS